MNYRIVADSSANLFSLSDMTVQSVPMKIITADREYVDTPELDVADMVHTLLTYKGKSGTSCPNSAEWLDAFGDADAVFCLPITRNLSGSHTAAQIAREEYLEQHPDAKVCVLDTLSAGPELQLLAERLQALILSGLSFEEIVSEIRAYQQQTHLLFSLESLKNLANNGRIHHTTAAVAGVLGIRMLGKASDEGTLQSLHKCRSMKHLLRMYLTEMKHHGFCGGKVRIAHCLNETGAQQLVDVIQAEFPACQPQILPCTALCSFYAEKGGLLVGFEG